jgi:small subunit ribosomal protein S20
MPVIKSAIKKLKQSEKHAAHNKSIRRTMKDLMDTYKKSPSEKSFIAAVSAIDKAAKTNVIHKNKASRLKSRLSKRMPKSENKVEKKEIAKKAPVKKAPKK